MKQIGISLRFDVDKVYGDHFLDYFNYLTKIRLSTKRQFSKEKTLLKTLEEYEARGTFFFRPLYTLPTDELVAQIKDLKCKIGLHADKTLNIQEMRRNKKILEERIGSKIMGITTHGKGLFGVLASGELRHSHFLKFAAEVGYLYDATSGPENPTWKPNVFSFERKKILMFGKHITIDTLFYKRRNKVFSETINICSDVIANRGNFILLLHPNRFSEKPIKTLFERLLNWFNDNDLKYILLEDICKKMLKTTNQ